MYRYTLSQSEVSGAERVGISPENRLVGTEDLYVRRLIRKYQLRPGVSCCLAVPNRRGAVVDHELPIFLKDREALVSSTVLTRGSGAPKSGSVLIQDEIPVALHHESQRAEVYHCTLR
jgi:hypothetical protein